MSAVGQIVWTSSEMKQPVSFLYVAVGYSVIWEHENADQAKMSKFSLIWTSLCNSETVSVSAGPISENEDPHFPLLGLHGNRIQCQASPAPLYHRGRRRLSANHYILANLSLGQVTAMQWHDPRVQTYWTPKKNRGCWVFVHLPFYALLSVNSKCRWCWAAACGELVGQTCLYCSGFIDLTSNPWHRKRLAGRPPPSPGVYTSHRHSLFWPPHSEKKGFHSCHGDICLITTPDSFDISIFCEVSGWVFQYLHHTDRKGTWHTVYDSKCDVSGVVMFQHYPPNPPTPLFLPVNSGFYLSTFDRAWQCLDFL